MSKSVTYVPMSTLFEQRERVTIPENLMEIVEKIRIFFKEDEKLDKEISELEQEGITELVQEIESKSDIEIYKLLDFILDDCEINKYGQLDWKYDIAELYRYFKKSDRISMFMATIEESVKIDDIIGYLKEKDI